MLFFAAEASGANEWISLIPTMIIFFVVFYLFLILPEQRRQKKIKAMLSSIAVGDKVVTRGGIIGIITSIKDDSVVMESGPAHLRVELMRSAIAEVTESKNKKIEESKKETKADKKENKKSEK